MTTREGIRVENKAIVKKRGTYPKQVTACLGEMNLPGSGQLLNYKGGRTQFAYCQHHPVLHLELQMPPGPPSLPHCPPVSPIHSPIRHGGLEPSPSGIHLCVLVPSTRKVRSRSQNILYKNLRLLLGTPRLTRVIQTSLLMAIYDILRDSNSGFIEHSTQHLSLP